MEGIIVTRRVRARILQLCGRNPCLMRRVRFIPSMPSIPSRFAATLCFVLLYIFRLLAIYPLPFSIYPLHPPPRKERKSRDRGKEWANHKM